MGTTKKTATRTLTILAGLFCLFFLYAASAVHADPEGVKPAQEKSAPGLEASKPTGEGNEVDLSVQPNSQRRRLADAENIHGLILLDENPDGADPMRMRVVARSEYWIGIQVLPVPPALLPQFGVNAEAGNDDAGKEDAEMGLAYVERIVPESPAAQAGVLRGDILLELGDRAIHTLADVVEQVEKVKQTEQVLRLIRGGKKMELKITPAPRPEELWMNGLRRPGMPGWTPPVMPGGGQERMQQMFRQLREEMERMHQGQPGQPVLPGILPATPAEPEAATVPEEPDRATIRNRTTRSAAQVRGVGDEIRRLEVSSQTAVDGKTTIFVKQITQTGDKKDEKSWEVETVEELPESIRADVKAILDP